MKKKVIFVTKALWIGGIETALINLLNHFDYTKYDVTVLVLHAELNMASDLPPSCRLLVIDREKQYSFKKEYSYVKLYRLTEKPENPSKLHRMMLWAVPLIRWCETRLYIQYMREAMKNESFDTAFIYSDVVAEETIKAIRAKKYVMFYHHGTMRHVYHDKIGYKKCDKIVAVSEHQANNLKKFVPSFAGKILVMHNLTDIAGIIEKSESPVSDTFDTSKFNIVTVARIAKEKGIDLAVRACVELVSKGFHEFQWWIIGGGPENKTILDMIKQLKLEDYIYMTGMKDNPYPYMKMANLYVQPSRVEGYPMTLLEAMILGKVVVSTDNPGAREIIINNKTGVLCDGSGEAIAEAVMRVANNKKYFTEIETNIQAIDFDKMNKECMDILEKIL